MQRTLPILLACLAAAQCWAHHGPVGAPAFCDTDQLVILERELTEVFWRNPHVRFGLNVVDESGEKAFWELETGVPSQLEGGGFTADMFPVGGQVKAAGFVSRHRDDFLGLRNMLLTNGLEYAGGRGDVIWSDRRLEPANAPDRERRWANRPAAEADSILGIWGMGLRPSEWMAQQDYDHVLSDAGRAAKDAFRPIARYQTIMVHGAESGASVMIFGGGRASWVARARALGRDCGNGIVACVTLDASVVEILQAEFGDNGVWSALPP